MNITATGQCGAIDSVWIMGNPGRTNTVWGDTDCDGRNDGWISIDTSKEGWALYDDNGNYVGQRGWVKPKRDYKALELQVDRAWDGKWGFNASYTLAYGRGNAEGPVNSDTDFADAGRTENFDNPWVNYGGYGYLANDRRHQFKFRGSYALTENLSVAATLGVQSGSPITRFGAGNPFDATDFHSYYVCVSNCQATVPSERVFVHSPRGADPDRPAPEAGGVQRAQPAARGDRGPGLRTAGQHRHAEPAVWLRYRVPVAALRAADRDMGVLTPIVHARRGLCMAVLAVFPAVAAQPAGTASLDADVAAVVQHEHLPGLAMAVVEQGRVIYRHAEGKRGDGGRIDEDTLFKIASNSKAMTAALLARLVQQGRLRWDDPVQRHLPEFRMHDAWVGQQMQVRDLLIHNSGLGLGAGDLMLWPEPNTFTRADIIAGLAHLKPVSSFRSHYAYDTLMYVVAGEVAAAAGGKPYDQLMREQVFEPLGMARCQVGAWSPMGPSARTCPRWPPVASAARCVT
ncbi:hypothetical protein G6F57_014606 [Rhizopus arrhizus]|nr:hypothetical protein G6F57_014606 [Rhizopus arrhizus]